MMNMIRTLGRGKPPKEALRVRTLAYPKLGQPYVKIPVKVSVKAFLSYASLFFCFIDCTSISQTPVALGDFWCLL